MEAPCGSGGGGDAQGTFNPRVRERPLWDPAVAWEPGLYRPTRSKARTVMLYRDVPRTPADKESAPRCPVKATLITARL